MKVRLKPHAIKPHAIAIDDCQQTESDRNNGDVGTGKQLAPIKAPDVYPPVGVAAARKQQPVGYSPTSN